MLPPLPKHRIAVVEVAPDRLDPAAGEPAFLRIRRLRLRACFEDGSASEPFGYDAVDRERLDAVVIAAHFRDATGRRHVYLRTAIRPPVALRPLDVRPIPEPDTLGNLWELPAGLVEADERSPEGLRRCAARELLEEVGFDVPAERIRPLGPSTFPAPGMIGERHFYFEVEVDPAKRARPTEDGSALERHAFVAALPVDDAVALTRTGAIEDGKTEIALRRLAEA